MPYQIEVLALKQQVWSKDAECLDGYGKEANDRVHDFRKDHKVES